MELDKIIILDNKWWVLLDFIEWEDEIIIAKWVKCNIIDKKLIVVCDINFKNTIKTDWINYILTNKHYDKQLIR